MHITKSQSNVILVLFCLVVYADCNWPAQQGNLLNKPIVVN